MTEKEQMLKLELLQKINLLKDSGWSIDGITTRITYQFGVKEAALILRVWEEAGGES